MTPRQRIEIECAARGRSAFVTGCIDALEGREVDTQLVEVLAGRTARWWFSDAGPESAYWLRVWAARGLLWAWDDTATTAVAVALSDEAWRVREMALKVIARHRIEDLLNDTAALQDDPVPRVRSAAERALVRLAQSS